MGGYRPWPSSRQATFGGGGSQVGSKLRATGPGGSSPSPTVEATEVCGLLGAGIWETLEN